MIWPSLLALVACHVATKRPPVSTLQAIKSTSAPRNATLYIPGLEPGAAVMDTCFPEWDHSAEVPGHKTEREQSCDLLSLHRHVDMSLPYTC